MLAVGAGGGRLDIFFSRLSLLFSFPLSGRRSFLSLSLWETARYRLKYCLKGPLSPKQPTNQQQCIPCKAMRSSYGVTEIEVKVSFERL